MGWLKELPNDSSCMEAGHATSATGWLKYIPKVIDFSEAGHTTSAMGWLKSNPKFTEFSEIGHTTLSTGWSKVPPNESFRRDIGQSKESMPTPMEKQPSSSRHAFRTPASKLCTRDAVGISQVALTICTTDMRLGAQHYAPSLVGCGLRRAHKLRGVPLLIRTCAVGMARHALQRSGEANSRLIVDTNQDFSLSPRAWFKATVKALWHRPVPETHLNQERTIY